MEARRQFRTELRQRLRQAFLRVHFRVTRFLGRASRRYYFEDYVRVYPGRGFNRLGREVKPDIHNFLAHQKFYRFAAQFVKGSRVGDVGCGSGYGCEMLKKAGAGQVYGCDISRHAIEFAKAHFGRCAEFTLQPITEMKSYADGYFDVTVCSEVLEDLKEYGMEERALQEMKRITRPGGLVVVGTPNAELLPDHGFSFDEILPLMQRNFPQFLLFENALVPFGEARASWEKRLSEGRTGAIVSERINPAETFLPETVTGEIKIKNGQEPGRLAFAGYDVDTTLLHNTLSWIVLATQ